MSSFLRERLGSVKRFDAYPCPKTPQYSRGVWGIGRTESPTRPLRGSYCRGSIACSAIGLIALQLHGKGNLSHGGIVVGDVRRLDQRLAADPHRRARGLVPDVQHGLALRGWERSRRFSEARMAKSRPPGNEAR